MLPNLIVVGAAKCGTTSLHRYLGAHPEITMSRVKELHYFLREPTEESLRWYSSQFPGGTAVRGESSPGYSRCRRHPGVPARIARVVPDAKLVDVVRDPVERVLSAYRERAARERPRTRRAQHASPRGRLAQRRRDPGAGAAAADPSAAARRGGPAGEVDPALRAELEARFGPDAAHLRELTGMRFETWSV